MLFVEERRALKRFNNVRDWNKSLGLIRVAEDDDAF